MESDHKLRRYQQWYAKLLRLYPKAFRERFGEEMVRIFNDLGREHMAAKRGLCSFVLSIFAETLAGIVRENITFILMRNKNIIRIALATVSLLQVPLVAMQFTNEVTWSLADFVVAGALLFGAGLTYELVSRRAGNIAYKVAVGIAVVTGLILIWANLAVGLIGNEGNPANLMFIGGDCRRSYWRCCLAFTARWDGAHVIRDGDRSGFGPYDCIGNLEANDCFPSCGSVWLECILYRLVAGIGFAVSTRKRDSLEVIRENHYFSLFVLKGGTESAEVSLRKFFQR